MDDTTKYFPKIKISHLIPLSLLFQILLALYLNPISSTLLLVIILFISLYLIQSSTLFKANQILYCSLISLSLGGAGMLLGAIADQWIGNSGHLHHHEFTLLNFSTLLMLAACIPACWATCKQKHTHQNQFEQIMLHSCGTTMMVIGMYFSHHYFSHSLMGSDLPALLQSHILMLPGMVLGKFLGLTIAAVLLHPIKVCQKWQKVLLQYKQ